MNLEHYRQRLLAEQQEALTRLERAIASVSEPSDGVPHDTADESSSGELRYQQLAQAEAARASNGLIVLTLRSLSRFDLRAMECLQILDGARSA